MPHYFRFVIQNGLLQKKRKDIFQTEGGGGFIFKFVLKIVRLEYLGHFLSGFIIYVNKQLYK